MSTSRADDTVRRANQRSNRPLRAALPALAALSTLLSVALPSVAQDAELGADDAVPAQEADAGDADAVPTPDTEADAGPQRLALPEWLRLDAEYRLRTIRIEPLELSGTQVRDVLWTEQRGRIDLGFSMPSYGGVFLQADILRGVLLGDNGQFGSDPSTNNGVSLTVRDPNDVGLQTGLIPGADPLDADNYVPTFRGIDPIEIQRLYGEVYLPVGLLRFGRQAFAEGPYLATHNGMRANRWGASEFADTADRVLFVTKLDQAIGVIRHGSEWVTDPRTDRGLFLGLAYDWLTQGGVGRVNADDTVQYVATMFYRLPEARWGDVAVRDFEASVIAVHTSNPYFDTAIWSFPMRVEGRFGDVDARVQVTPITGGSREISEGFAVLASSDPTVQDIRALGAQALVDWNLGPVTLTFEFDYATGDDDPRASSPVENFSFARDLNVGLLLFERILAFESARSVAVGVENLSSLDSESFPITEVATDGRFTNAIALFPQVTVRAIDTPTNRLHARVGVLFAWPEANGVVDPIHTILADDGNEITDDAVNFHGGDPGSYYGTELDLQLEYAFRDTFFWTVEGAVLFPGSSLEDEHGDAVNSFLFENRLVVTF